MGLPCRVRVNYRGYAVAVHRRLCYPHVTSAAVVYGGWGYWTNGQGICLTRSTRWTSSGLMSKLLPPRIAFGFSTVSQEATTDKRSDNIPQWVGGPGGRVSKTQSVLKGYL